MNAPLKTPRPNPVAIAQAISAAIPIIVGFLVATGLVDLTPNQAGAISDAGVQAVAGTLTGLTTLVTFVMTVRARGKVTPLSDPRDARGVQLVSNRRVSG